MLYVADVLIAALAIALLSAPVAFHRLLFRTHAKARILRASHIMAIGGLMAVALAVSCSVALVLSVVESGALVPVLIALTVATFVGLWLILPLLSRGRDRY
jgi:hypothetical protein